jgi:cytochrome P450
VQVPREAAEDVVVSNVLVPKGTTLMLLPAVVQRNPQIWGDDAESFNPDRWDTKLPDAHAFAAFFQGPRQCIGRVFAMIEFKVTLIEIVSKFQFEAVEGSGVDEEILLVNPSPLLRPSGGLKARVRRL